MARRLSSKVCSHNPSEEHNRGTEKENKRAVHGEEEQEQNVMFINTDNDEQIMKKVHKRKQ